MAQCIHDLRKIDSCWIIMKKIKNHERKEEQQAEDKRFTKHSNNNGNNDNASSVASMMLKRKKSLENTQRCPRIKNRVGHFVDLCKYQILNKCQLEFYNNVSSIILNEFALRRK